MTIKINGKVLTTRKPTDLDAQLEATTGCNSGEIARMIGPGATADIIARAIAPFLADALSWQEVLVLLQADMLGEAIAETAKLYAKVEPVTAPEPTA